MAKKNKRKGRSLSQQLGAMGDPFGAVGDLAPGTRIKRGRTGEITEDDPRWDPRTMGNRRRRVRGFTRGPGQ